MANVRFWLDAKFPVRTFFWAIFGFICLGFDIGMEISLSPLERSIGGSRISGLVRRSGKYSDINLNKCNHYVPFMKGLSRVACDAIYWSLLLTIIIALGTVVYHTQKAHRINQLQPDDEGLNEEEIDRKKHRARIVLFIVSIIALMVAITCAVMSAFAALAIAWCFGEDLINFYWSFWTVFEIGSVVAILGTVLQQWYSLSDRSMPAWNFAMGTPIPVVATLMHASGSKIKKIWKRSRQGRERSNSGSKSVGRSPSTAAVNLSTKISLQSATILHVNPLDGKCILEVQMPSSSIRDLPHLLPSYSSRPLSSSSTFTYPEDEIELDELDTNYTSPRKFSSSDAECRNPKFEYPVMDGGSRSMKGSIVDDRQRNENDGVRFKDPLPRRDARNPRTTWQENESRNAERGRGQDRDGYQSSPEDENRNIERGRRQDSREVYAAWLKEGQHRMVRELAADDTPESSRQYLTRTRKSSNVGTYQKQGQSQGRNSIAESGTQTSPRKQSAPVSRTRSSSKPVPPHSSDSTSKPTAAVSMR